MSLPINGLLPTEEETAIPVYAQTESIVNDPYAILRDYFKYTPETGVISRTQCYQSRFIGKPTLIKSQAGDNFQVYIMLGKKRKVFAAWKVATYLMTGIFPNKNYVVHFMDGDKSNLCAQNLSVIPKTFATHLNNNLMGENLSVKQNGKRFVVAIKRNSDHRYLGTYDSEKEARVVYMREKLRLRNEILEIVKLSRLNVVSITKRLYEPCAIR
jgi:hypothetical protein